MYRALHEFDLYIGGTLGVENLPLQTHKAEYLIGSIMEEAIASSQIEGAATTRKTAKEMLWKNRTPKNHAERMIVNNYETIRHIVEHKDEPISAERLFEIHRLITRNTLENQQDEGRYRDGDEVTVADNIDGEIVYYPPPYQQVTTLMNDLFNFFNTNDSQHCLLYTSPSPRD